MKIAVVGGGIFGLTIASVLAKEKFKVDLYEKEDDVFKAASGINQFRLHRGYHYPRSIETIKDCIHGELRFREFYPEVVIDTPHKHYYAIAKGKSFLSADQCEAVWNSCGLKSKEERVEILNEDSVERVYRVEEAVINPLKFKEVCLERCKQYGVKIILNREVDYEDLEGYDLIVSATYSASNSLLKSFPDAQKTYQFELIEKLILKLPRKYENMSVVVQDGPFTCIDPYGKTGFTLMGNVTQAIHYRKIGKYFEIPEEYRQLVNKGVIKNPKTTKVSSFLDDAEKFFPGIKKDAEHIGSMFTVRTVLPYREHDDARPTIIEKINDRLITVFSGKIPTCVDVAEQVLKIARIKQIKKKNTTVGVVGLGRWGANLLRELNELCTVKTCVNKNDLIKQNLFKEIYPKINFSFNYADILNDEEIDAVIIATPIETHFDMAMKALRRGKKVFLEKPIGVNLTEAEELIETSKGKIFFTGHIFLYSSCYNMIKELTFGDSIKEIEFNWNKFGTFKEDIFLNLVSQDLAIAFGLLEKVPKEIELRKSIAIISDSDWVSINLKFEDGESCKINIDRTNPQKKKEVKIITQKGKVYYWIDNKIMKLNKEEEIFDIIFESYEEPLKKELKRFLEHVESNQEPLANKEVALNVAVILERIKKNI